MTIAWGLLLVGWGLLAGSQRKQFGRLFHGRHLPSHLALAMRAMGAALLFAALAILLWSDSSAFAVLTWICLLSVSAMVVVLILAWLPRWIPAQPGQADSARGSRQRT